MSDFHIKAGLFLKEEVHEKTSIEYAHDAGAVPDAIPRARVGDGGRAGGRRHRAAGAAGGSSGGGNGHAGDRRHRAAGAAAGAAGGAAGSSGCGTVHHIGTGGGKWHCRSERRGQHRGKRGGGGHRQRQHHAVRRH